MLAPATGTPSARPIPRARGETDADAREAPGPDTPDHAVDLGGRDACTLHELLTQHEHLLRDVAAASLTFCEHHAVAPQARGGGGGRGVESEQQHQPQSRASDRSAISRVPSPVICRRTRTSGGGSIPAPRTAHSMKVARTSSKYGSRSASSSSPSERLR